MPSEIQQITLEDYRQYQTQQVTARPNRKVKKSKSKILKAKKNMDSLKPYTNSRNDLKNSASSYSQLGEYYGALDLNDRRIAPPIIDYQQGVIDVNGSKTRNGFKRAGSMSHHTESHQTLRNTSSSNMIVGANFALPAVTRVNWPLIVDYNQMKKNASNSKIHTYLKDSRGSRSTAELQPLFGERTYTKSSISMLHEGGEQSIKNESLINESRLGSGITLKKMTTLNSIRRIEKPKILKEVSKITQFAHNPDRGILNKYHNISEVGPGSYTIPGTVSTDQVMNKNRNGPKYSFGNNTKEPYFPEYYQDFLGRDSPPLNKYHPNVHDTKIKNPEYSQNKFERFHIPEHNMKLYKQVPVQYTDINQFMKKTEHATSRVNMMGLGKKGGHMVPKDSQLDPGPGTYDSLPNEIAKVANSQLNLSKSRGRNSVSHTYHTFGASREQQDKLQFHGQQRYFLGKAGADVGQYSPEDKIGYYTKRLDQSKNLTFGTAREQRDKLQYHGQQSHFLGRSEGLGPGDYSPEKVTGDTKGLQFTYQTLDTHQRMQSDSKVYFDLNTIQ